MTCKHASLMMIYANQASEMDDPWRLWELRESDNTAWFKPHDHIVFRDEWQYRQIPKTILINGFEVPEPMMNKPEINTRYFSVNPRNKSGVDCFIWRNDRTDSRLLNRGLCHESEKSAIIHAKALFSLTEVK